MSIYIFDFLQKHNKSGTNIQYVFYNKAKKLNSKGVTTKREQESIIVDN
jgi:hypothetical protein